MRLLPASFAALAALALSADIQKPGAAAPAQKPAATAAPADAKEQKDAKLKDIVRLLKVLAWPAANSEAAHKQLEAAAKDPKLSAYPAAYWKDYQAAASPEAFEKILVPLFDKAYSHDDIKALLKFVNTQEFKFFVEKNPEIKVKKEAYEGFSKYMTEVGGKLREKHGVKAVPAPVKK